MKRNLPDLDELMDQGMTISEALQVWAATARSVSLEYPPDELDCDLSFLDVRPNTRLH